MILLENKKTVIPAFNLYSKEVGEGQGYDRITTLAYEIHTSLENAVILKSLLCQISSAKVLDLKFVPYGLDRQTNERTIREIIIQQNSYLDTVNIIPVFEIMEKDKEQEREILGQSQFFWLWNLQGSQKVKVNTY